MKERFHGEFHCINDNGHHMGIRIFASYVKSYDIP